MRKPRDFDAELRALDERAKQLRQRRLAQFGELVIATGADALPVELLAGALLAAVDSPDMIAKEEWRARGAAFFQRTRRKAGRRPHRQSEGPPAGRNGEGAAPGPART